MYYTNKTIVKNFIDSLLDCSNKNLRCQGTRLINYETCIAQFCGGRLIVNDTKYSSSTSKIQGLLRKAIEQSVDKSKIKIVHVTCMPKGNLYLDLFIK